MTLSCLSLRSSILLLCYTLQDKLQGNNYTYLNLGLMISLCAFLSLCVPFALVLWMSLPCPPLPLSVMSPRVIRLIVLVSPSLYLHSRSRLSASSSSSSSSWLPLEVQDPLHCCWAPGPQPLQARVREAWSSQASSELAVVLTFWSVSHKCFQLRKNP